MNFKVDLNKALTYLLKRKTTIMIVMARISNSKPPPPAAPVITIFVFDDELPTVGTSSALQFDGINKRTHINRKNNNNNKTLMNS